MTEIIGSYGGYRKTMSFCFVCLIYHATEVFCDRNYSFKNDALQVLPDEYGDLRAFWEKLCNIYQGTIVLKKQ